MKKLLFPAMVFILAAWAAHAQYVERNLFLSGSIFEDVTEGSGFDHQGHGKCIALGDFDLDGDFDVYISVVFSTNRLFQNEGNLQFEPVQCFNLFNNK